MKWIAPFLLILFLSCKSEKDKLPFLSYTINAAGEKELYEISYNGQFKNQLNAEFSDSLIEDKVFLANFFFTRCPSICPPMRQQLIGIANEIDDEDFMILSHTIDPGHDNPLILKDYAEATGISIEKWQFLTASESITKNMAEQYKTNFKPNEDGTDFYHSSYVALMDKDAMIRGFYDLLKPKEVELLKIDIESLLD
ncbi:MAG: SCO family protein [Flavobacteriaceae bacterium]|nr:MAG: SCO family protein [Flavobacteriaceae bacterium]